MKRIAVAALLLSTVLVPRLEAQPSLGFALCATYDFAGRGYLPLPDRIGGVAEEGWIWQIVLDAGMDGTDAPSMVDSTFGWPSGNDVLLATGWTGGTAYLPRQATHSFAYPLTFPTVFAGVPVYLRVFGADTLEPGVPYIETPLPAMPALPTGFATPLDMGLFAAGGGMMDRWLAPEGRPVEEMVRFDLEAQQEVTLDLDSGIHFSATVEQGGLGLQGVQLERFQASVPNWEAGVLPLGGFVVLTSDQAEVPGAGFQASLSLPFTSEEVADLYGSGVAPEEMRLYRESPSGWVEEPSVPEQVQEGWRVVHEQTEAPLIGRWTLAPAGYGSSVEGETDQPLAFRLHPVYPSPFNPDARIRLDLPTALHVRLEVFDLLGRRVAVLQDGILPAGSHAFTFSGGRLASGTYFLRAVAGDHRAVQKMVLIR